MNDKRILAIDPGTKGLGFAVFEDGELIYYGVKVVRANKAGLPAHRQAAYLIHLFISQYQPEVLAIKQPLIIQQSFRNLALVIREIKRMARHEGLILDEHSPKAVRQFICAGGEATQREARKRIVAQYPELAVYINQRSKWEEMYYARMFEAIGVGLASYNRIETAHNMN